MRQLIVRRVVLALLVFSAGGAGCGGCVKDDPAPEPAPQGTPINTASVGVRGMKKPPSMVVEGDGSAP